MRADLADVLDTLKLDRPATVLAEPDTFLRPNLRLPESPIQRRVQVPWSSRE